MRPVQAADRATGLSGAVARAAVARPWLLALIIVLVSAMAGTGVTMLRVDDGMRTAFAGDTPVWRTYEAAYERFTPAENDMAVLFEASGPFQATDLNGIADFAIEAQLLDGVDAVLSIFSLRTPPDEDGATRPLVPDLLGDRDAIGPLLEAVRDHPLNAGRLLSEDLRHALVIVTPTRQASGLEPARALLDGLEAQAAIAAETSGLDVAVAGLPPIREFVIDGMVNDLVVLNALGIAIGSIVCLIALRSVVLASLTGLPAAFALAWSLGAMGWFGLTINTLTNAVPILIIVLALADSLHLTFETRRCLRENEPGGTAVVTAARRIIPACALTSLTTALAFAALLISESELVRSLGWAGMVATLLSFLAVLTVHPVVFALACRSSRLQRVLLQGGTSDAAFSFVEPVYRISTRHPLPVSGLSLVVLGAALFSFLQIEPRYSFLENLPQDSAAIRSLGTVEAVFGGTASIDVVVDTPEGGGTAAAIDRVATVERAMAEALPDATLTSVADLAAWTAEGGAGPAAPAVDRSLEQLPAAIGERFVSAEGQAALVRAYVADEGADAALAAVARLDDAFQETGEGLAGDLEPTGLLVMSSTLSLEMIGHIGLSFLLAIGAVCLLIGAWFRSVWFGVMALVPNLLPIACVGAWLHLSGRGLQFSSALALTIAFGIAVDDTIHVLNRIALQKRASAGLPFDLVNALGAVTPAVVTTSAVMGFGMLGTHFSSLPTIQYFGYLTVAVFILALVSVVMVLPAIATLLQRLRLI